MSTNTLACTTSTTCAWGGLAAKDTDAIVPSNTTAQAGEDVHLGRDGGQGGVPPPTLGAGSWVHVARPSETLAEVCSCVF
jgi:hypothetical protein